MPRWCSWTCACVHASVAARSNVAGSRYLSARARASSRDGATSVENVTRAVAPGASRTRRRRLKIGSSTAPTVLDSGWPSMTDSGVRIPRPRPRNRRAVGLKLHVADGLAFDDDHVRRPDLRARRRPWPARREQGAELGHEFGLHEQVGKCRMGQRRPRAAPARSPRTRSARSRVSASRDS